MLQTLRDKAQGWITWVIIGAIAVTFILFGTESIFSTSANHKTIAKVGDYKITQSQLDSLYQRFLKQPGNQALHAMDPEIIKKELLQSLIEETVLINTSKNLDMRIASNRINSLLGSIPSMLDAQGRFSPQAYDQYLRSANFTDADFRQWIQDSLLKEQLQQGIMKSAFTLTSDIEELSKYNLQKRSFRYTIVPKDQFAQAALVTPEQTKQFYASHLQDFLTDEQVAVEYIHLSKQDLLNKIQPTEAELSQFYQENIGLFTHPESIQVAHIMIALPKEADEASTTQAKAKMAEIQAKLKAGEDFAELAKKYSQDKQSGEQGGTLGWITKGEMVSEFEKSAFSLSKNQVSEPVQSEFGFHLIKLFDKKPEAIKPLAQVKDEVLEKLKNQLVEEKLISMADQLASISYDAPDSLHPAAEKLDLPIQKTELFSNVQGPKESILQNQAVLEIAFNSHSKEDKNNSDLIKVNDENYIVLRVTKHEPSKQKTFEQVKDNINQLLTTQKIDELTKAKADKIIEAIFKTPQTDIAAVMGQHTWVEQKDLLHSAKGTEQDVLNTAFAISRPMDDKTRALKATRMQNGDYAVVWLTHVQDGSLNGFTAQEQETYQNALTQRVSELDFALFTMDLFKRAKVEKKV